MKVVSIFLYALICLYATGCASRDFKAFRGIEDPSLLQPGSYARLDGAMERERTAGRIPAGALAVWMHGDIVYTNQFGFLVPDDPKAGRVTNASLFDLASLAKPLAGLPLGVDLAHTDASLPITAILDHSLDCDDEVELAGFLEQRSASALASHARTRLTSMQPLPSPGYRYANATWAALGALSGRDVAAAEEWLMHTHWAPRGAASLTFRPDPGSTVASGVRADGEWIRGTPFDPVADLMVSALSLPPTHSGLFGTAEDVARFGGALATDGGADLAMLLAQPRPRVDAVSGAKVWVTPGGMRGAVDPPFAPPAARPGRILYHTGYTGCLLWIDLDRQCAVALTTNASVANAQEDFDRLAGRIVAIVLQGYTR
jgi:CubicO group peptidase (beta-lactamase class C family)